MAPPGLHEMASTNLHERPDVSSISEEVVVDTRLCRNRVDLAENLMTKPAESRIGPIRRFTQFFQPLVMGLDFG